MTTTENIEPRVARGAAWLDEHHPGWERLVDLGTLDLSNAGACVLCQVVGDYWQGVNSLGSEVAASNHGFTVVALDAAYARTWTLLDDAWTSLIKERFATGTLSDEATSAP